MNPFAGRSISVVNDLTPDEQMYLYRKTRELKEALKEGSDVKRFCSGNEEQAVYLVFLEDSTRTKESFRNAAKFHRFKVNDFQTQSSSIVNKKESLADTFKMLFGYSERSLFVVRSKLEGVCSAMEQEIRQYAMRIDKPLPAFINVGELGINSKLVITR